MSSEQLYDAMLRSPAFRARAEPLVSLMVQSGAIGEMAALRETVERASQTCIEAGAFDVAEDLMDVDLLLQGLQCIERDSQ